MESNTKKEAINDEQHRYKKLSKSVQSNNFCYCIVGRVTTVCEAIEKKAILDMQNRYKKWSKEVKSGKFCYYIGGRVTTICVAIEKRSCNWCTKPIQKNKQRS